ncbi:MAG: hypothetical protein JEZ06_12855 [Anaerolineaceae bacterium]|nr:hypothetical protein [Anaerolineaceae bacterium]
MEKIRELISKDPLVSTIVAFVVGLIIGQVLLGWVIWPVQWEDAAPEHLEAYYKQDYLKMVVESYASGADQHTTLLRWDGLGDEKEALLSTIQSDPAIDPKAMTDFNMLVDMSSSSILIPTEVEPESIVPETTTEETNGMNPVLLLSILCGMLLVVGGALFYILVLKRRPGLLKSFGKKPISDVDEPYVEPDSTYYDDEQDTPIAQFMTTYTLGDDLYDDSFSVDSVSGEFLGECGVGISETIGTDDPKKVTAFEVWLFDKNDIQTITKVLMSEHGFSDVGLREKLGSKGEPNVITPGKQILLETATLQLEARIVDMNYGQSALPDNSFFDRITLELAVWSK